MAQHPAPGHSPEHEHNLEAGLGNDIEKPVLHHTATNQTISGMTISPELFEKLYLTPKVPHVGDNYKRFANPTPMGFMGFVISTFTFAMVLMGWGGAKGLSGVAGIFFFVGPVLLLLGTIFEWIMGNFFPVGYLHRTIKSQACPC
jgi:uncharacterized protein